MVRHLRLDRTPLGNVAKTAQGGIKVEATLTRSGVFEYQTPSGVIREYRPPSEVARADALATLKGAPITVRHPPAKVDPSNFRRFSAGHVGDDVRPEGHQIAATLYVQDAEAIRAIEAGTREASCGYHCDVDETPGVVPAGEQDAGKPYDRVQRNMTYNHLALVDAGRAGDARLRLDSSDEPIIVEESRKMKELIEGVEYETGTPAHAAACDRRDLKLRQDAADRAQLLKERDEAKKAAKEVQDRLDALEAHVKKMATPEAFDRAVAQRLAIVEKARKVLGAEFKADGLTNNAIMRAAVDKAYPDERLDDKIDRNYVAGLFRGIRTDEADRAQVRNDAADKLLRGTKPISTAVGNVRSLAQVRADAMESSDMRCARPLAMSRRDRSGETRSGQSAQLETMK